MVGVEGSRYQLSRRGVPENKEGENRDIAPWLAGVFEAGGTISFLMHKSKKKSGREYTYATPIAALYDADKERVEALQKLFGGGKYFRKRRNSWEWRVGGKAVEPIVSQIAPFSSSRREMVAAIQLWELSDTDERLEIGREMQHYDRNADSSIEDYLRSMRLPSFVAGIIDCRGSFSTLKDRYQTVRVYNTNRALLEALKETFGGRVRVIYHSGTSRDIDGRNFVTKRDQMYWSPDLSKVKDFIEFVRPSLRLPQRRIDETSPIQRIS